MVGRDATHCGRASHHAVRVHRPPVRVDLCTTGKLAAGAGRLQPVMRAASLPVPVSLRRQTRADLLAD